MNLRLAVAILSVPQPVAVVLLGGPALGGYLTLKLASTAIGNTLILATLMLWGFWLLAAHRVVVTYAPQVRDNGDFLLPWAFFAAPTLCLIGGLGGSSTGTAAIVPTIVLLMGPGAYIAGGCAVMMAFRKARLGVAKLSDAPPAALRRGNRRAALFAFPPLGILIFGKPLAEMTNAVRARLT